LRPRNPERKKARAKKPETAKPFPEKSGNQGTHSHKDLRAKPKTANHELETAEKTRKATPRFGKSQEKPENPNGKNRENLSSNPCKHAPHATSAKGWCHAFPKKTIGFLVYRNTSQNRSRHVYHKMYRNICASA